MKKGIDLLFKQVDNSPLIIFRVFFGLLMFFESWGAIATGWVSETFVDVDRTFTFMGFEWTQFLIGKTMYFYYFIMGIFGLMIMVGYKYILATISFFILWGLSYFMQKCHYNNHYYLVWLISGFMAIVPANRYYSLDAKRNPELKTNQTSYWTIFIFQLQIALVYLFASTAKLYPGWLENKFLSIRLKSAANWFRRELDFQNYADFLELEYVQYFQVYAGIFFDLLVIPLLLIKRTRTLALVATLTFHIANSITLQIGIFPYFAIAFALFFYPRKRIHSIFFKSKTFYQDSPGPKILVKNEKIGVLLISVYFLIQFGLPLRHWLIKDNVLWTEEGHRLSWRMMLRTKSSHSFRITCINNITGKSENVDLKKYTTFRQKHIASKKPDMIWQLIQMIKLDLNENGVTDYKLLVQSHVSVNGGKYYPLIDPNYDLSNVDWNPFGHQEWILPCPEEYQN